MTEENKGPEEAQAVAVKAKGRPRGSKGKASKAAMESAAKTPAFAPASRRPAKGGHLRVVSDHTGADNKRTPRDAKAIPDDNKPKARGRSFALAMGADQLTDKQALFCDGVANGLSLSDAYRAAYSSGLTAKQVHEEACKLMGNPKVRQRLEAINREKEEQRRMMAASDASLALDTFRRMMESADTDATKVRAAELLAKAAGVFIDKVETTDKTDRTVKDIEQAIAERLKRLGLAG